MPGGKSMNEPISSTAIVTGIGTASLLSYWSTVHPSVIIGAFAGASVYVLSNADIPKLKRLSFFLISFFVGIIGADYAARVIESITSIVTRSSVQVDTSIGALAASAVAIKMILSLISKAQVPPIKPGGTDK